MNKWTTTDVEVDSNVRILEQEKVIDTNPQLYIERGLNEIRGNRPYEASLEFEQAYKYSCTDEQKRKSSKYLSYYNMIFQTKSEIGRLYLESIRTGKWIIKYGVWLFFVFFMYGNMYSSEEKESEFIILLVPIIGMVLLDVLLLVLRVKKAAFVLRLNEAQKKMYGFDYGNGYVEVIGKRIAINAGVGFLIAIITMTIFNVAMEAVLTVLFGMLLFAGLFFLIEKEMEENKKKEINMRRVVGNGKRNSIKKQEKRGVSKVIELFGLAFAGLILIPMVLLFLVIVIALISKVIG